MARRDLEDRLIAYGARIVKLVAALPNTIAGRRMGDQLLRFGTSAGANYQEAQGAESKEDFIHKLQITLKEIRESTYWLRLIARSETLPVRRLSSIIDESLQLRAIFRRP